MDELKPSIKPTAYTYGMYLGLLSILSLVVMYVANMEKNWLFNSVVTIITVFIYVYGIKTYKQKNDHYLSLSEALKVGLAIALIGGLISAVYSYVHYTFIHPEYIENIREVAAQKMEEMSSSMTDEQVEAAIKMNETFTSPFATSTITLVFALFFGFIVSLITGLIIKKEKPFA